MVRADRVIVEQKQDFIACESCRMFCNDHFEFTLNVPLKASSSPLCNASYQSTDFGGGGTFVADFGPALGVGTPLESSTGFVWVGFSFSRGAASGLSVSGATCKGDLAISQFQKYRSTASGCLRSRLCQCQIQLSHRTATVGQPCLSFTPNIHNLPRVLVVSKRLWLGYSPDFLESCRSHRLHW